MIFFLSLPVLAILVSLVFLLIYGLPELSLNNPIAIQIYRNSPDFVKKKYNKIAMKQWRQQQGNYRKNIHVVNFFRLYPQAKFSGYLHYRDNTKGTIRCWEIIYGRYYLKMEFEFKSNFSKTGIKSFDEPEFKLIEMRSITNIGRPNSWSAMEAPFFTIFDRQGILEVEMVGEKKEFGLPTWEKLLKNNGDLNVVLPKVIRDKPIKIIYDFSKTEESAERGDLYAQVFLANAYGEGKNVPKDDQKAMKWLKVIFEGNSHYSGWAAYAIGYMYSFGKGVDVDKKKALKWTQKSAELKYLKAFSVLAWKYDNGEGVEKNLDEAIRWMRKGIDLGDPSSYNDLAYIYADKGEKLSEAKRLVDFALSKKPNEGNFLDTLGWIYYKQGKYEEAAKELKKASTISPSIVVYDHLGDAYERLGKNDEAIKCWKRAIPLAKTRQEERKKLIQAKLKKHQAL